jgi:hypothetical protein
MSKQALKSLNQTLKALEKSRNKEMAKVEKVVSGVNKTFDAQIKAVKDAIKTTEASVNGDAPKRGGKAAAAKTSAKSAKAAKEDAPKRGRKAKEEAAEPKAKRGAKADKTEAKAKSSKKADKESAKKADRKAAVEKASKKEGKVSKKDKAGKSDKADKKALKAKEGKNAVGGLKPKAKKGLAKSPVAAQ